MAGLENEATAIDELEHLAALQGRPASRPKGTRLKNGSYAKKRTKAEVSNIWAGAQASHLQAGVRRAADEIERAYQIEMQRASAGTLDQRRTAYYAIMQKYGEPDSAKREKVVRALLRQKGYRV